MRSRAHALLVTFLVLLSMFSAAAAQANPDESDFLTEVLDEGFGVGREGVVALTVGDSATTVSETTQQSVIETYEESDVICALRQAASREGELLNEETDLCEAEDGPTVEEIAALVASEFQSLHLTAPPIMRQPATDWALVNMEFIVMTDAGPQEVDTTILGAPVTIRATPIHYSWDFGDGSAPLATTDQGQPYPNQTVSHVYTDVAEAVSVTLTTTWQGEFRIGDGAWLPITGFATTTSTADPVEIVAVDVNLVPNE